MCEVTFFYLDPSFASPTRNWKHLATILPIFDAFYFTLPGVRMLFIECCFRYLAQGLKPKWQNISYLFEHFRRQCNADRLILCWSVPAV